MRNVERGDGDVGLRVDRFALGEQAFQHRLRIGHAQQRPIADLLIKGNTIPSFERVLEQQGRRRGRVLDVEEGRATFATLHRWTQIVGKTRLALCPKENHWWHVALYVTARGLTTSPIPYGQRAFEVEFGSGYDIVLLTNFLHHFDKSQCTLFLQKVAQVTLPEPG